MKKVCVYCGSAFGSRSIYKDNAQRLGLAIAKAGLGLVYGGGRNGLMGVLAQAAMSNGAHVTGIMPNALVDLEGSFYTVDEYHEVESYHERKMLMFNLSDAFIALPGGPGTLEELIEQIALFEIGYHNKPIVIVNTVGFWNDFLNLLKHIYKQFPDKFSFDPKLIVVSEPEEAVRILLNMK